MQEINGDNHADKEIHQAGADLQGGIGDFGEQAAQIACKRADAALHDPVDLGGILGINLVDAGMGFNEGRCVFQKRFIIARNIVYQAGDAAEKLREQVGQHPAQYQNKQQIGNGK